MSATRRVQFSASARVLLAMTAMVGMAVVALVTIAYFATTRAVTSEIDAALEHEAQAYSAAMRGAPQSEALADATRAYLGGRALTGSGRDVILLVNYKTGRTLSNSGIRLEDAPGNTAARVPPRVAEYSRVSLGGKSYRVLSTPVRSRGEIVGVFQAAVALTALEPTARNIALTLTAAGILSLAIVLPLAYWATRRSLRPLRQMASDAEEISHATPGRRIAYEGPGDELGSLAHTLNAMLERLENAFEDQRRFVADASHELRTPVAVIRGNIELLRSGVLDEENREGALSAIEEESVRMTRLLDELLSLARFESVRRAGFQPLSLGTLVEETAARTRALGERRIAVDSDCETWVEGDPDLLEQALVNLARNAVAHTKLDGMIVFTCSREAGRALMTVADDGPGIPSEELDRVFDRFYRATTPRANIGSGAGLGLAITQRIVELHDGTISVENVEPHGARFTISLPIFVGADGTESEHV